MSINPPAAAPQAPKPGKAWYRRRWVQITGGSILALSIIGAVVPDKAETVDESSASNSAAATTPDKTQSSADDAAAKAKAEAEAEAKAEAEAEANAEAEAKAEAEKNGPASQQAFVAAVAAGRDAYEDADNELVERRAKANRNEAACAAIPTRKAANWVGTIKNLDTNGGGKAVLELEIGDGTKVSTWNNAISDFSDNTLIPMDSPLYDILIGMDEGDRIRFSGSFIKDSDDCISEKSMTLNGQMQTPNFTFRFSKISAF